ncbi:hypothetical protein PV518_34110 [Streptomyces sp. ND04-05B]|uniref:hypothetical protein n=1 Tax=Streptomyces sp. ND04-05B TaxID=3028693 RepID=UPI0029B0CFC9|nr:hypothetical protein [Streptomyces sp. ND04-05B]MDX3067152.1 hypothetical protein [Streptomyces sp. ND04-05B]
MKMPRIECESCGRGIAAGPVAGRPSKGRVWRHDPPQRSTVHGDALVSCHGSLAIVDLPLPTQQLELAVDETPDDDSSETLPLF